VLLPHPMMTRTPAEIGEIADRVIDEVVRALTGDTTAKEAGR
jgi:hypothetical protein